MTDDETIKMIDYSPPCLNRHYCTRLHEGAKKRSMLQTGEITKLDDLVLNIYDAMDLSSKRVPPTGSIRPTNW
ncbi:hypothetical protein JTE90_001750 [Oedothorax gibbosus]|uniref:Uncharacterized protein n=1 Tax=Oedothorax gibbosus TaxID=931172 RepID=A0AAV6V5J2_9ARAC|nr:hypothetical protein JTE90_001750 [Oedothorax gibbosus]